MNPFVIGMVLLGIAMTVFTVIVIGAVVASGPRSKRFQNIYDNRKRHDGREGINEW